MNRRLSAGALRHFKQTVSNENRLIAQAIASLLPPGHGLIVDVGAGLGDIAEQAFPDREALLIDILEFEEPVLPMHRRLTIDFFDVELPSNVPAEVMVFSHVLQYIDEDHALLRRKLAKLAPHYILTVLNDVTEFMTDLMKWFDTQGINHNPERAIPDFPGAAYDLHATRRIESTISCKTFADLAMQIGVILFDSSLGTEALESLARWLHRRLGSPTVAVPQCVSLFGRRFRG